MSGSTLPTCVRAMPRAHPSWKPAGLAGYDRPATRRWAQHQFRYAPYQCAKKCGLKHAKQASCGQPPQRRASG